MIPRIEQIKGILVVIERMKKKLRAVERNKRIPAKERAVKVRRMQAVIREVEAVALHLIKKELKNSKGPRH